MYKYGLEDWPIKDMAKDGGRLAEVSIHLKWPSEKGLKNFTPKERNRKIDEALAAKYQRLIKNGMLQDCERMGTRKRPSGVKAKIKLADIDRLSKFSVHVFINNIEGLKKKKEETKPGFYCIKMTVAIEIEGQRSGYQNFEERYVLIKAKSSEDAYKKIAKQKKTYQEPYINDNGEFVRWRIESLDDCYETFIEESKELDEPDGVEVFSVLKRRKMNKERFWDGKW